MNQGLTERAARAVTRYEGFTALLRGQSELVLRRGATDGMLRDAALSQGRDAARGFVSFEHAQLNEDTQTVAVDAHDRALRDLGARASAIPDRFADFIFSASLYTSQMIAAQVERDVMTMAHEIRSTAQRVDLYARSGRHTVTSAAAAVMLEDAELEKQQFSFVDRAGRTYKSTKHIRDIYRQHLLNVSNEVYMDVVADHGREIVKIGHPDPKFKWFGEPVAIVSHDDDFPLYYDIKGEVFHPSSDAFLTITL